MNHIPAESEFIHCARVEVLDKDVGTFNQFCENSFAVGCFSVEGKRFLVAVELQEVVAGEVGVELELLTCGIANTGAFDFDYIGT